MEYLSTGILLFVAILISWLVLDMRGRHGGLNDFIQEIVEEFLVISGSYYVVTVILNWVVSA